MFGLVTSKASFIFDNEICKQKDSVQFLIRSPLGPLRVNALVILNRMCSKLAPKIWHLWCTEGGKTYYYLWIKWIPNINIFNSLLILKTITIFFGCWDNAQVLTLWHQFFCEDTFRGFWLILIVSFLKHKTYLYRFPSMLCHLFRYGSVPYWSETINNYS